MSCENLITIRKNCDTPLGGIKEVYVRDFESLGEFQSVGSMQLAARGDNTYTPGAYTLQLFDADLSVYIPVNAIVTVAGSGYVTNINVLPNTFYFADPTDTFTVPGLESHLVVDNSSNPFFEIISFSNSHNSLDINSNKEVTAIKGRTENDFGETVSTNWYKIDITKEGGNFQSLRQSDLSNGTLNYLQTLTITIPKANSNKLNLLKSGQRNLLVIFIDNLGTKWLFGYENGAIVSKVDKTTGTKISDANNSKITFTSTQLNTELTVVYNFLTD